MDENKWRAILNFKHLIGSIVRQTFDTHHDKPFLGNDLQWVAQSMGIPEQDHMAPTEAGRDLLQACWAVEHTLTKDLGLCQMVDMIAVLSGQISGFALNEATLISRVLSPPVVSNLIDNMR